MKKIKKIFLISLISISVLFTSTETLLAVDSKNLAKSEQYNSISKENSKENNDENGNDESEMNIPMVNALESLPTSLENGGFEQPVIPRVTVQLDKNSVPYWDTTAYERKIELFKQNSGTYIPGVTLIPREGKQAAELNADETSSLYQNIATTAGKTYEWGISHRGRQGRDTMALIIGPRQSVEPGCQSKKAKDQFMKMADWLKSKVGIDIGLDVPGREIGCSKKIILYSKTFAAGGSFTGGDADAFSWTKSDEHSQEWNVWLMTSDNNQWEDYGSIAANPDYDFTYEVPEGSPESIFAFSAIQTAKGNDTAGNFIDNIQFKEYYNVEVYTTPGGKGTYMHTSEVDVDYYNNYTGNVLKDEGFYLLAHELTGADFRKFIGADVNGEFIDANLFMPVGGGNYGYEVTGVDKHYKIRLMFSARFVTYDVNVGKFYVPYDDYHYDGTTNTNYEVPLNSVTLPSYTSHAAKKHNNDGSINDGWRFIGWRYLDAVNDMIFDGIHRFDYIAGAEGALDTLNISGNLVGGGTGEIRDISAEKGATMVAQWKYRQAFIPRLLNINSKIYEDNDEGGTVSILDVTSESYQGIGKAYYASNNEYVTATANVNEGYEFRGWYDENGNLLSPSMTYRYAITDGMVSTTYAYFVKVHDLSVTDEVRGNMGDKYKYFNTTIYLYNLEKQKTFSLSYSNNGTQSNPDIFKTDANGNATVSCKLKDHGSINLTGLLEGSTYRILEDSYASEGYSTTGTVTARTALLQDTGVTVVNTKDVVIPLGVHNDNKPYLYIAVISIACLIIIIIFHIKRSYKKS